MQEMWVWFLGWEDPLEKEMVIHSWALAWKIPWIEEPGRLQSMGPQRVGHDLAIKQQLLIPTANAAFFHLGFPDSWVGKKKKKKSACNAADPSSIPEWGRSPGEGAGYPLQHSWASLMTQLVKNPPAMWETWVQFLGWEDPLEKGKATHSNILI